MVSERFLATVEADKLRGHWVDPTFTKVRFGDYATDWLASITHVRPTTRVNIEGRLRNHILPKFGAIALGSIRAADIRTWIAELSAKGLTAGSVASIYRTLSKILKTAEIDGFIARSPCIGIELPREQPRDEMHFLSHEQVAVLADEVDDRFRTLIYTAAYTGLRWGELAALKAERVNPLRRTIEVVESLAEVNGHLYCGPTKTGANRTVSLPKFLSQMLQNQT
jgi:integrase